jgi:hydroxymethylglutaryl-CoA lyase
MAFPKKVTIVEVSPRDGLQNEKMIVPTEVKIDFINQLSKTGLSVIEATSFVSPKWIPQLADHEIVFAKIDKSQSISYPVLVPNVKGLQSAMKVGVKDIAVFTTPSEEFSKHNTNTSVAESMQKIREIMEIASSNNIKVRGYLSCVLGCPYEGEISPEQVTSLAVELMQMGCYEISLGDTIGVGTPFKTKRLIETIQQEIPVDNLAVHFHDTFGQALANIYVALEMGIHTIDSSVAGLGGCPYAKGASGNVATEDVVYLLQGLGIQTGIDLQKLINVGRFITDFLQKPMYSKVNRALLDR